MTIRVLVAVAVVAVSCLLFGRTKLGNTHSLPPGAVTTMNWLRGLAAVAVLVGHTRGLFMQDFGELRSPSIPWKVFYLLSALGHEAVVVFFILSGFLVGSTVLAQIAERRWEFRDYFLRRLTRLYVVLVPGLILTAAWDTAGIQLFGGEGLYGGVINARHLTMPDVRITGSWGHFVGNLAFLQHLFIAPYGSNGPLWSLPYEFWAYVLFPFLVQAGRSDVATRTRIACAAGATLAIVCGGWKLGLYLSIWLLGAVLALWWRHAQGVRRTSTFILLSLWGLFAVALLQGSITKMNATYADLALGVATALLIGGVLARRGANATTSAKIGERAASDLAAFSYTLYVAHYPVLTFLFAATMAGNRWPASGGSVAAVLAIALALLAYAFGLARLTEAHTDRVRAWLVSKRA
jgi:peptidoglycan/LPS O-acetylase OafA/YrhL